jgi:very-short-patch-repair endonuclease
VRPAAAAAAGLPQPSVGERLGPYLINFLSRAERLAVETDGWQAHSHRPAFEDDRARDAVLQASGYAVIRFTWRQVLNDPHDVTARIGEVLKIDRSRRAPAGPSNRSSSRRRRG